MSTPTINHCIDARFQNMLTKVGEEGRMATIALMLTMALCNPSDDQNFAELIMHMPECNDIWSSIARETAFERRRCALVQTAGIFYEVSVEPKTSVTVAIAFRSVTNAMLWSMQFRVTKDKVEILESFSY